MTLRERWAAVSLRGRLVLLFVLLLGLGLTVAGTTTGTLLHGYLIAQTDEQIAMTARNIDVDTLERLQRGADAGMPSDYFLRLSFPRETRDIAVSWTVESSGGPVRPGAGG